MLTKQLWKELEFEAGLQNNNGRYVYSDTEIAMVLVLVVFLIPFCLFIDIALCPLELLYLVLLKIIKKKRGRANDL